MQNSPQRLLYLDTWLLFGELVERLGDGAYLEDLDLYGMWPAAYSPGYFWFHLCLLVWRDVNKRPPLPPATADVNRSPAMPSLS